jgi:hypothetical protein
VWTPRRGEKGDRGSRVCPRIFASGTLAYMSIAPPCVTSAQILGSSSEKRRKLESMNAIRIIRRPPEVLRSHGIARLGEERSIWAYFLLRRPCLGMTCSDSLDAVGYAEGWEREGRPCVRPNGHCLQERCQLSC